MIAVATPIGYLDDDPAHGVLRFSCANSLRCNQRKDGRGRRQDRSFPIAQGCAGKAIAAPDAVDLAIRLQKSRPRRRKK